MKYAKQYGLTILGILLDMYAANSVCGVMG